MNHARRSAATRLLAVGGGTALLCACSTLLPQPVAPPTLYTLGTPPAAAPHLDRTAANLTLIVDAPLAAAGTTSARMVYARQALQVQHFAHSEWVDTPARMLAPVLVGVLVQGGVARAVVADSSAAGGDLRLHTELLRLQQNFDTSPSQVQFTLRASLLDETSRRVLDQREFNASAPAPTDDPAGGAQAAQAAMQAALADLATWCQQAGLAWRAAHPEAPTR